MTTQSPPVGPVLPWASISACTKAARGHIWDQFPAQDRHPLHSSCVRCGQAPSYFIGLTTAKLSDEPDDAEGDEPWWNVRLCRKCVEDGGGTANWLVGLAGGRKEGE
jgi:hypothetical protein